MKALYLLLLILLIPALTVAQQDPVETRKVREDLLQKSKSQKTTGFLMLGLGAAAAVGGAVLFDDNFTIFGSGDDNAATAGAVLAVAGGLSVLGSIPFFIASSNNRQKAIAMDVGVKLERIPQAYVTAPSSCPAVAVRFQLR